MDQVIVLLDLHPLQDSATSSYDETDSSSDSHISDDNRKAEPIVYMPE